MASTEEDDPNRFIKLNPALDVDLDEIDDKEFDIPRIDKPPTLESILNAPDEDLPIADNCIVDATLQVCDTPTSRLLYNMSVRQQYFFRVMIKYKYVCQLHKGGGSREEMKQVIVYHRSATRCASHSLCACVYRTGAHSCRLNSVLRTDGTAGHG